jgi:hypothetical protein
VGNQPHILERLTARSREDMWVILAALGGQRGRSETPRTSESGVLAGVATVTVDRG